MGLSFDKIFSFDDVGSGALSGGALGSFLGPAGILGGAFIGGQIGGQNAQKRANQEAFDKSEKARVDAIMREFGAMQQTENTIASGFKRSRGSSGSAIPDPIADTTGFIGGGIPNGQAGTAGTF